MALEKTPQCYNPHPLSGHEKYDRVSSYKFVSDCLYCPTQVCILTYRWATTQCLQSWWGKDICPNRLMKDKKDAGLSLSPCFKGNWQLSYTTSPSTLLQDRSVWMMTSILMFKFSYARSWKFLLNRLLSTSDWSEHASCHPMQYGWALGEDFISCDFWIDSGRSQSELKFKVEVDLKGAYCRSRRAFGSRCVSVPDVGMLPLDQYLGVAEKFSLQLMLKSRVQAQHVSSTFNTVNHEMV